MRDAEETFQSVKRNSALRGRRSLRDMYWASLGDAKRYTSHEVTAPRAAGPSGRTASQYLLCLRPKLGVLCLKRCQAIA